MDVKTKGTIYLILCSLIWGAAFPLIQIADQSIPPLTYTASRMAIGAAVLILYLRLRGEGLPRFGTAWIPFLIMGVFGTLLPVVLLAYSEEHVSGGFAAVVLSAVPVITVVLAHFFARETLTTTKAIGVLLGCLGAVVVLSPNLVRGVETTIVSSLLILVVALSRSSSNVYARVNLRHLPPAKTAAGMMIVATAIALVLAFALEDPVAVRPSHAGIVSVLVSGVLCSAIAYILLYWIIANRGATFASLVEVIMPAAAVVYSMTLMGISVQPTTLAGMGILAFCLIIMNGYLGKGAAILPAGQVSAETQQ